MSRDRFNFGFKLSDELIIMSEFDKPDPRWSTNDIFPWIINVAPIDYKARLEAELTRVWGGFEEYEENDAVVGEVDGIEICRYVTVYRRTR